ncbi:hypothetical protein BT96DRAFT_933101 [Gymnopus androsaceus JB14]|uniref:Uncharacterized protein n=1 Tax=Gymnopus androsaceus JB14 TaxID=1447944 RepID=A0A6A4IAI6_9AGAR|nr:hypothetical protein BT96DRAFT_933101 [Gymnopus androsaceus JB14]
MLHPQSSWALASKDEKHCVKSMFFIPKIAKCSLLHDKHISIWDMLKFELPSVMSTCTATIPSFENFFSSEAPSSPTSEIFQKLCTLPLLPAKLVSQLNNASHEHWMKGELSIWYAHVPREKTLFLLWVISYWMVLYNHYTNVHKPWTHNLAWIQENCQCSNGNLCQETTPKAGFAKSEPIHSLWRILGTNWMNSTAVDNALELLAIEFNRNTELNSKFVVLDTDFMTELVGLFGGEEEFPPKMR